MLFALCEVEPHVRRRASMDHTALFFDVDEEEGRILTFADPLPTSARAFDVHGTDGARKT